MLSISYANTLTERVGQHGLDPAQLAPGGPAAKTLGELTARLAASRGTGWERWRDLHLDPMRAAHVRDVKALAARHAGAENLVVLGIGGSALGNIALQAALNPPTHNLLPKGQRRGPRVFVVDNIDPLLVRSVLDAVEHLDPGLARTVFNVISKSGETAETAAQFMIIRDLLTRRMGPRHAERIVAVTDPAKGTMRRICDDAGYATLPVPDGVGGRFSVLSPVGLFSAAMAGIDIDALLDGAREMDQACSGTDVLRNPAALLAYLLVELGRTRAKPLHVMMPYSNSLYLLADWFRQLWAESLGKKNDLTGTAVYAGFTPIKALGTTDQHSQVQLYREGPNDKVFVLIDVQHWGGGAQDVPIPSGLGVEALRYLEGATLARLLDAEKRATEFALVESHRPNLTVTFPRIDERHVGQFIYLWEMVTAYAGLMLHIDAYDQPAVETGKQATFGLMGRAGYEQHLEAVRTTLAPTKWTIG